MKRNPRSSQTFVFFLISFGAIWLLCGLGLDGALLYLSKARISRACDAAVISGVKNFPKGRDQVSAIMRNIAAANYTDLSVVPSTPTSVATNNLAGGDIEYVYLYTNAARGNSVTCTIGTGSAGQVTRAQCDASVKQRTLFMSFTGLDRVTNFRVHALAEAQRRPRLIMLVLDRSWSLRVQNTGYLTLPPAVSNFLTLFDTNADRIGMVSFSDFARLEMPITNNFIVLGTNKLSSADSILATDNPSGIKFGGSTAAEEGMRLGLETLKADSGYTDPRTLKYIVFFTDGEFNSVRSLYASPCWTNTVYVPSGATGAQLRTNILQMPNVTNIPFATAARIGAPTNYLRPTTNTATGSTAYSTNLDIWMMPGSINFTFRTGNTNPVITISQLTNMSISVKLVPGETNMLVVPGFVIDGVGYSKHDTAISQYSSASFIRWPDTATPSLSTLRRYMVRHPTNLWGGLRVYKPDDPDLNGDGQPDNLSGSNQYPAGAFYWPMNTVKLLSSSSFAVGQVPWMSTNLSESDWRAAGSLFYNSSGQMAADAAWQVDAPDWVTNAFASIMTNDAATKQWRPISYRGVPLASVTAGSLPTLYGIPTATRGAVLLADGTTNVNAMAWGCMPTHFYDAVNAGWRPFTNFTDMSIQLLAVGNWKTRRYCDEARQDSVTIYTLGFGSGVPASQGTVLRAMANDPTVGSPTFQADQPIGKYYFTTNAADLFSYFKEIAERIQAVITQ